MKRGRDGEEREGKEWVKRSRKERGEVFFFLLFLFLRPVTELKITSKPVSCLTAPQQVVKPSFHFISNVCGISAQCCRSSASVTAEVIDFIVRRDLIPIPTSLQL